MLTKAGMAGRKGFTLIEVLVTVIVIGVLAAVVIPAVTNQLGAADPSRILSDATNIRTGLETFNMNVRPKFPGDVEDLANSITASNSTTDADINGSPYAATDATTWKGPYIEKTVATLVTGSSTEIAFTSGYGSSVRSGFAKCQAAAASGTNPCLQTGTGDYIAVQFTGLDSTQADAVNLLVDSNEATSGTASTNLTGRWKSGNWRFDPNSTPTVGYFLAVPFK